MGWGRKKVQTCLLGENETDLQSFGQKQQSQSQSPELEILGRLREPLQGRMPNERAAQTHNCVFVVDVSKERQNELLFLFLFYSLKAFIVQFDAAINFTASCLETPPQPSLHASETVHFIWALNNAVLKGALRSGALTHRANPSRSAQWAKRDPGLGGWFAQPERKTGKAKHTPTYLSFLISHFYPVCNTGRSEGDVDIYSISDRESEVVRFIIEKSFFFPPKSMCPLGCRRYCASIAPLCFPVSGKKSSREE